VARLQWKPSTDQRRAALLIVGLLAAVAAVASLSGYWGESLQMLVGASLFFVFLGFCFFASIKEESDKKEHANLILRERLDSIRVHQRNDRDTLARKYRQLCYYDDYGNLCDDKFQDEFTYYLKKLWAKNWSSYCGSVQNPHGWNQFLIEWDQIVIETGFDLNSENDDDDAFIDYTNEMSGVEFEKFVAQNLEDGGWFVTFTSKTGDQGVDLIAERDGVRVAVQCKRSAKPVGNKAVQEVLAGKEFSEASEACVISNQTYTKAARQLAASTGVKLLHFDETHML
jgi:restriction system protein